MVNNVNSKKNIITISKWIKNNKNLDSIQISGSEKEFIKHLKNFMIEITSMKSKNGETPDRLQAETTQRNDLKDDLLNYVLHVSDNEAKPLDKNDLSIQDKHGNIRVIFEYKRSINSISQNKLHRNTDMMHVNNLNCKAFQEIVSYYLREKTGLYKNMSRVPKDSEDIIGIITDGIEWFVISNDTLKKYFLNDYLIDIYRTWCGYKPKKEYQTSLLGDKPSLFNINKNESTDDLYSKIHYFIDMSLQDNLQIGYIDLSQLIHHSLMDLSPEKFHGKLISFYRFLSRQCLLDQDLHFPPNKLNYKFYNELLYIMGLQDTSNQKGISLIPRSSEDYSNGSLIQLVYSQIGASNKKKKQELFSDAVNITMSLINRIIFLKLLEGQLISIRNNHFKFITTNNIKNFTDLSYLFFNVMNNNNRDSHDSHYKKYKDVPYLNSSLFKPSNIENKYRFETRKLDSGRTLNLFSKTTLRKNKKKDYQRVPPKTLEYLIDFLNDYKFRANCRSSNKRIINASILGMIFEKINGYKDGSYYTPTYITNYIAKHAIDSYLLTKVNNNIKDRKQHFGDINNLHKHSAKYSKVIKDALKDIKILDPAVGSGHFLVSALNYLLYLKNYFGIIQFNNYEIKIADGHLFLKNTMNGKHFKYNPFSDNSKSIREELFKDKTYIIEYNIYGVDINLNSVNITKLRLWIELLKDSYYKDNYNNTLTKMSTMPNLEMNIKVGNSLATHILKDYHIYLPFNHIKVSIKDLKDNIESYRKSSHKDHESILYKKIEDAISRLSICFDLELITKKYGQTSFFKNGQKSNITSLLKIIRIYSKRLFSHSITKMYFSVDDDCINKIKQLSRKIIGYNTFEWPLEFPDLINIIKKNNGHKYLHFIKFNIIITNPPYISYLSNQNFTDFIKHIYSYKFTTYQIKSFVLFLELSMHLTNSGYISMIIPNTFLTNNQYLNARSYLLNNMSYLRIINSHDRIFPEAAVDNCIISFRNYNAVKKYVTGYSLQNGKLVYMGSVPAKELAEQGVINVGSFNNYKKVHNIIMQMKNNGTPIMYQKVTSKGYHKPIKENYGSVKTGAELYEKGKGNPKQPARLGYKNPYIKRLSKHNSKFNKRFLGKKDIYRYKLLWKQTYVKYGSNLANRRNESIFKKPRLLIGQTLDDKDKDFPYVLKATYVQREYICSKNVFIVHSFHIKPMAMLAILNSKLLNFFIIEEMGLVQRKTFPQIRNYNIRQLLIPQLSKTQENCLIKDVKIILRINNHTKRAEKANEDINEITMNAFKLDKHQRKLINSFNKTWR